MARPVLPRAALILLVASAAVLVVSASTSAQSGKKAAAKYRGDLEAFFQTMDRDYPFFATKKIDKDWKRTKKQLLGQVRKCRSDAEFIEIVSTAMKCLRDGHMRFEKLNVKMPNRPPESYPGIVLLPATKNRVVVLATTSNHARTLPPGTLITRIDGVPARRFLEQRGQLAWKEGGSFSSPQRARFFEYRLALTGPRGTKHKIHYLSGRKEKKLDVVCNQEIRGWEHNYNMPEVTKGGKSIYFTKLESGIGYIYLRRMDDSINGGFRKALEAHGDAKGWIVDLRGNTGGGYDQELKGLLSKLQKPVAGIIDAGCVSAGETLARDLVQRCQAKLFGATTAGSSSKKKVFKFPSGIAEIRYSVASRFGPKGKAIEYNGVEPDFVLEADPAEVAAGKNTELLRAEEYLLKQIGEKR